MHVCFLFSGYRLEGLKVVSKGGQAFSFKGITFAELDNLFYVQLQFDCTPPQGGNSWGAGGGVLWPPNFWPTPLFSRFSHTTDHQKWC